MIERASQYKNYYERIFDFCYLAQREVDLVDARHIFVDAPYPWADDATQQVKKTVTPLVMYCVNGWYSKPSHSLTAMVGDLLYLPFKYTSGNKTEYKFLIGCVIDTIKTIADSLVKTSPWETFHPLAFSSLIFGDALYNKVGKEKKEIYSQIAERINGNSRLSQALMEVLVERGDEVFDHLLAKTSNHFYIRECFNLARLLIKGSPLQENIKTLLDDDLSIRIDLANEKKGFRSFRKSKWGPWEKYYNRAFDIGESSTWWNQGLNDSLFIAQTTPFIYLFQQAGRPAVIHLNKVVAVPPFSTPIGQVPVELAFVLDKMLRRKEITCKELPCITTKTDFSYPSNYSIAEYVDKLTNIFFSVLSILSLEGVNIISPKDYLFEILKDSPYKRFAYFKYVVILFLSLYLEELTEKEAAKFKRVFNSLYIKVTRHEYNKYHPFKKILDLITSRIANADTSLM